MKYFLSLIFCLATITGRAQIGEGPITALAGPAGNYVYIIAPGNGQAIDTVKLANTDYYLVERAAYDNAAGTAGKYKELDKSQPVKNSAELRKFFSEKNIAELQKSFELPSEAALVDFFRTNHNPARYGLYYLLLQTKMAAGDVYLDKTAKMGATYIYRATRVDKNGGKEVVGTGIVTTGAPNRLLELLHPRMRKVAADDSLVVMSWKMPVDSLTNHPPEGVRPEAISFIANGLKARIMLNDGSGFKQAERLLPSGDDNDTGATLNLNFRKTALPEKQYSAYALIEDEVGNIGAPSDTLTVFTIGPGNMPRLKSLNAGEVPDGVRLSWQPVKPKPYIVGVKLTRYSNDDKGLELGVVPLADTFFADYSVEPGVSYRYLAELQFLPGTELRQLVPAQAAGASTIFSDPLPPFNVRVSNVGENILLEWDAQKQASMFGYYIYRGTSPKNMELLAGPVRGRMSFTDTAHYLSGRSQYFYSVQGENYRQVMSPMSGNVSITPKRKIETVMPKSLGFYFTGKSLLIHFPDVREDDNAIVGYVVRGREKGVAGFRFHSNLLTNANTEDSIGFVQGSTYQYQVAAVSMRGDTSAYSELYEFNLPKDPVEQLGNFYVRNTSEGVMLSWPSVVYPSRKAYNVYRRKADEEAYAKIASVPATQFSYADAAALNDEVYVYSISVVATDDREGDRSEAKSIRRTLVKATTISE